MKPIEKQELFQHLSGFLKSRGVELTEGSYAQGIKKSCDLLTDAINLGQKGLGKAKVKLDEQLEHMRQVIHEKTAPKSPPSPPPAAGAAPKTGPRKPRPSAKSKARKAR